MSPYDFPSEGGGGGGPRKTKLYYPVLRFISLETFVLENMVMICFSRGRGDKTKIPVSPCPLFRAKREIFGNFLALYEHCELKCYHIWAGNEPVFFGKTVKKRHPPPPFFYKKNCLFAHIRAKPKTTRRLKKNVVFDLSAHI